MKRLKKIQIITILICTVFFSATNQLDAGKPKKQTPETAPIIEFSEEVIQSLEKNKIDSAITSMNIPEHSPKTKYLLGEMQRIEDYKHINKRLASKDHRYLYNVGAAYHNLYLFLMERGIENKNFYKNAENFYLRAIKSNSPARQNYVRLTLAALYAVGENTKKAEAAFAKVNQQEIEGPYKKNEALALYYASLGDVDKALPFIEESYKINKKHAAFWLGVSDDFYKIKDSEPFQNLMKKWNVKPLNRAERKDISQKNRKQN